MQVAITKNSLQGEAILNEFDRSSEQLKQSMIECRTEEAGKLQGKPSSLQKQEAQEPLQLSGKRTSLRGKKKVLMSNQKTAIQDEK